MLSNVLPDLLWLKNSSKIGVLLKKAAVFDFVGAVEVK